MPQITLHIRTADDPFDTPKGNPPTERVIATSVEWAEKIREKIDERYKKQRPLRRW